MRRLRVLIVIVFMAAITSVPPTHLLSAIQPNFVIVLTDDQRWDTIGRCKGGFDASDFAARSNACMPKLQQDLIARGRVFTRGYVTTSMCCPSRASILTGRYARHHGVTINQNAFESFADGQTLATWLHGAGYRTGLFGKYLNDYGASTTPDGYVPPGWDSWHAFWNGADYSTYSLLERDPGGASALHSYSLSSSTSQEACAAGNTYATDLLCTESLGFLRDDASSPFLLYYAPFSPHLPAVRAQRDQNVFAGVALPTYPNLNQVPEPNPPSYLPDAPLGNIRRLQDDWRKQLEANGAADDAIGALVDQLEADGRLASTVFIFLSDNGLARGNHRWDTKGCEFEECVRVPFVVACPPSICPAASTGVDSDHDVLNIDIAPTILDLAGIPRTTPMDGTSLVPLLYGSPPSWRSSFEIEYPLIPDFHGIVSLAEDGDRYKYVELSNATEKELFDLTVDPWELQNLAGDGSHTAIEDSLRSALHVAITPPSLTLVSGPSGPTNQTPVTFQWSSDEAASFECAVDAGAFQACGSGTSGSASYPGVAQGAHTFKLRATDLDGNLSATMSRAFTLDTFVPTVSLSSPGGDALLTTTSVAVSWSGSDKGTGIARYDLLERPGVTGVQSLVQSSLAKTYARLGDQGATYCYQVLAVDKAGNSTRSAERCAGVPADDTAPAITYRGTVTPISWSTAYLGTLTQLTGSGQEAEFSFTGRKVGILARRDGASGKAGVYLDGVLKTTVDLFASPAKDLVYVYMPAVPYGPHTVRLTWTGTKNSSSTGTSISVDGFTFIG